MRFDSSLPQAKAAPFREAVKRSPDKTVNALLPLALAVGAGIVSFFGVGLIALGLRLPVSVPLVGSGIVTLAALLGFLFWMIKDNILWTTEHITGMDAKSIEPPQAEPIITIEVSRKEDNAINYLHLPCTEEQFAALVNGWASGTSFSEANWCGRGQPFSKDQYIKLRNYLLSFGIMRWRSPDSPTQGMEPTSFGKRVIRELIAPDEYARTRTHALASNSRPELESGGVGGDDE